MSSGSSWPPPTTVLSLSFIAHTLFSPFVSAQYLPPAGWKHSSRGRRSEPNILARQDNSGDSQDSTSTDIFVLAHDDFCLYGPPDPFALIENAGGNLTSWCSKAGHNTRLIPDGTLHGVTYVKAQDYVQVSGNGDFTKLNLAPDDEGGQIDPSNAPSGYSVATDSSGSTASSWVMIISPTTFCLRACTGNAAYCPTTYDQMGCWFLTGDAVGPDGTWQDCQSDDGDPPGVVDGSTYSQGASPTPTPTAPSLSSCQSGGSVSNGQTMPPFYTWDGTGVATAETNIPTSGAGNAFQGGDGSAPAGGPTTSAGGGDNSFQGGDGSAPVGAPTPTNGTQSGGNSASAGGSGASTSWVPVQTCTPCSGGAGNQSSSTTGAPAASQPTGSNPAASGALGQSSTSSSTGSSGDGTTLNVGVTQVQSQPAASDATGGALVQTPQSGVLQLDRRDGSTTTSGGQCCFTTYTPSVVGAGGSGPTSSPSSGAADASLGGSGASSGGSAMTSGSPGLGSLSNGSLTSGGLQLGGGASSKPSSSGSSLTGGSNSTPSTNGTTGGNGTNGAVRRDLVGLEGYGRVLMSVASGLAIVSVLGGFALL